MDDKNGINPSQHQTARNQTLQKQLARSLALTVSNGHAIARAVEYEQKRMRDARAIIAREAKYEKQMRDARAMITHTNDTLATLAREANAYVSPKRHLAAMLAREAEYEKQIRDVGSMITHTNDTLATLAREANAYVSPKRHLAAMLAREAEYEKQIRDVGSMITHTNDTLATLAREANAYVSPKRHLAAMLAREAKAHQYWQKQTSLGFPNIIRGELAANPSSISTSEQRRTPLLEPSPTAITSETYEEISPEIIPTPFPKLVPATNHQRVFIVHGQDHAARDAVAEHTTNWGLKPIILDKQPNKGRTIIEKFEDCADEANFAIVLFTPDDVGASVKNRTDLRPRARQNVILELGYFIKALGRQQVCILYKEGVELPSDIYGVVYVPLDDAGEWRQKVIREMGAAKILVNVNKI